MNTREGRAINKEGGGQMTTENRTEIPDAVRAFLSAIGRKGGLKKVLDPAFAREMGRRSAASKAAKKREANG